MPRRPARRRTSTPHPCNGACGLAACTYVSTRRGALTDHVNAGRGVRPYACALCAYATSFKQDLTSHARRAHPEHCAPDGSCKALGVGPRRPRRLRMPGAFRDAGVAPQEFQVVKQMVRDCNRNDLRAFPDDPYVAEVHRSNAERHRIAGVVLREVLRRRLLRDGADDAGGCGPLVLRRHCVLKLSLDRRDNGRPHFVSRAEPLRNLFLVPLGLNHRSNPVAKYGAALAATFRERAGRPPPAALADVLRRESKTWFRCERTLFPRQNAAYAAVSSIWHRRDPHCRAAFGSVRDLFRYALELLESQGNKCAVTGIWLEGRDATASFNVFQMSLDAVDPPLGHVPGNLRWIVMCLNATDCSKDKTHVAADDAQYPTAWTPALWRAYATVRRGRP